MAPRPPIQAVINSAAVYDPDRRKWNMALFNEDFTPFSGGGGGGGSAEPGPWVDLTLINGWTNYDPAVPVGYRFEEGNKVIRFRGLADGRARSPLSGANYKLADLPEELAGVDTALGIFVWEYGVGYEVNKFEINATNGLSVYINTARIALFEGETIGLE